LTVEEALRSSGIDPRDARLLLAAVLDVSTAIVAVSLKEKISPEEEAVLGRHFERRRGGEPVAYILGRKEFYSLEFEVDSSVLVPRPETEELVASALDLVEEKALWRGPCSVLDLGTGSGCIAVAIKSHFPAARVTAVEESAAALEVARRNAAKHGLEIDFRQGRWFEPVAAERFDLIVSNPPYVAEDDPHLADLRFEPISALVSGRDGLDAIREIVREAPRHLAPAGGLLLEHGMGQDRAVRDLMRSAGLEEVQTWPDLAGIPRVSGGKVK
jgi:release factor glutamine methyltransferase